MKNPFSPRPWMIAALLWLVAAPLHAQFYSPETRYHDVSQRYYVVELARVLAWKENLTGPKVAEVTYALASAPDGSSKWDVRWLDTQGRMLRQFNVAYPASLLLEGPAFYREVLKQMTAGTTTVPSLAVQDLIQGYWKGADLAGYSRMASLRAAFDIAPGKPTAADAVFAPKLAGLLPNASLPMLSGPVTIDSVLLSRGAAWLAVSESMVKDATQAGPALDALWAPVMFLAGRENAAADLWKKAADAKPGAANAMAGCWDKLLSQPKTADLFLFVMKPENRRFLLPVMNYHSRISARTFDFENLLPPIFGEADHAIPLLYEHFPCIVHYGSVSTGHQFSQAAPYAWQDWIETLQKFEPTAFDYTGYKSGLAGQKTDIKDYKPATGNLKDEESFLGFDAIAPLIEEGHREGTGKLVPVATASARDLLNYGWEETGLQIGARYIFVKEMWGVDDLAQSIGMGLRKKVSGLDRYLDTWKKLKGDDAVAEDTRLQNVEDPFHNLSDNSTCWDDHEKHYAELSSRCWLTGLNVRTYCSIYFWANKKAAIVPFIERVHNEGGALCDGFLRQWFGTDLRGDGYTQVPGAADYAEKMAAGQKKIEVDPMVLTMLKNDYEKMPPEDRAKELEGYYWQDVWTDPTYVLDSYIEAHDYDSAKRFYREAGPGIEAVAFSDEFGPRRYTLAMLENDKPAMAEALKSSETGSSEDIRLHIMDAALKGTPGDMGKLVDEWNERYPGEKDVELLKGFIPLIPALNDPMSMDHNKALDYFASTPDWITLQWILARNAKLSVNETVRFFGGAKADEWRQLVVLALLKDKAGFARHYDDIQRERLVLRKPWKATVLLHYLRNDLLGIPQPVAGPDLKPADSKTLTQRMLSSLEKTGGVSGGGSNDNGNF